MKCRLHWCDRDCYGSGDLCRRHGRQAQAGKDLSSPPVCLECATEISHRRVSAKFCGIACQMKWNRREGCYTEEARLSSVGVCAVDGCEKPKHANGFCNPHNLRFLRHGDPLGGQQKIEGCKSPECTNKHFARGFCHKHYYLDHYYRNIQARRSYLNARRKHMRTATPPWADLVEIERIYARCPEGHHVDHVVPLRGRNVCGLHDAANLQYLPGTENQRKSNRWQGVAGPNRESLTC